MRKYLHFLAVFSFNFSVFVGLMLATKAMASTWVATFHNPLEGAIAILSGIAFFVVFENFRRLINFLDAEKDTALATLAYCFNRCVTSLTFLAIISLAPRMIH